MYIYIYICIYTCYIYIYIYTQNPILIIKVPILEFCRCAGALDRMSG